MRGANISPTAIILLAPPANSREPDALPHREPNRPLLRLIDRGRSHCLHIHLVQGVVEERRLDSARLYTRDRNGRPFCHQLPAQRIEGPFDGLFRGTVGTVRRQRHDAFQR